MPSHRFVPQPSSKHSPSKRWTGSGASPCLGLGPRQSLQADAVKVLAGAGPARWAKCPRHPRRQWPTVHKFCLPDRQAQPGLRKLLFSFKYMLCFSRENSVSFLFFFFLNAVICLSVFPPNLWLSQTASTKFKEGFYLFWICYLPPAIFICCHLILLSAETANCHCLCTFSLCFFPPEHLCANCSQQRNQNAKGLSKWSETLDLPGSEVWQRFVRFKHGLDWAPGKCFRQPLHGMLWTAAFRSQGCRPWTIHFWQDDIKLQLCQSNPYYSLLKWTTLK